MHGYVRDQGSGGVCRGGGYMKNGVISGVVYSEYAYDEVTVSPPRAYVLQRTSFICITFKIDGMKET